MKRSSVNLLLKFLIFFEITKIKFVISKKHELNLNFLINSFSSCVINVINFHPEQPTFKVEVPIILVNGLKSTFKTHLRKYVFCISNIILYPEYRDMDEIPKTTWVNYILFHTGPRYQFIDKFRSHNGNGSEPYFLAGIQYLLEPHYALLISTKFYSKWINSFTNFKSNFLSTIYLFYTNKLINRNGHLSNSNKIICHQVVFICKVCKYESWIAISFPFPAKITKDYLDQMESWTIGYGSKVFIDIGPMNSWRNAHNSYETISEYNKFTESPFPRRNIDNRRMDMDVNLVRIMENLIFESIEHGGNWSNHLKNYALREYPQYKNLQLVNSKNRQGLNYQDTRIDKITFQRSFVIFEKDSFNFITCDGVTVHSRRKIVDITQFVQPFKEYFEIWLWIFFGLLILPAIVSMSAHLFFNDFHEKPIQKISTFNKYTFNSQLFVSSFLENGSDFNFQKHLKNSFSTGFVAIVYVVLTIWLMSLLLINNMYKGILTSVEVAPSPPEAKWRKFHELADNNFKIVTPTLPDKLESIDDYTTTMTNTLFGNTLVYLRAMIKMGKLDYKYPKIFNFRNTHFNLSDDELNQGLHLDNKRGFLEFISNCNKTAFVDLNSRLNDFLQYFNNQGSRSVFMKGDDEFLNPNLGWMFYRYSPVYMGRIYRRLQHLIQSGIYNIFRKWINRRRGQFNRNRNFSNNNYASLGLSDSQISSLLIIYVCGCLSSFIIFWVEIFCTIF